VREIADRHGRELYDETDVERGLEFHAALKHRCERDLAVLAGPEPL
jgi:hypothetical protein